MTTLSAATVAPLPSHCLVPMSRKPREVEHRNCPSVVIIEIERIHIGKFGSHPAPNPGEGWGTRNSRFPRLENHETWGTQNSPSVVITEIGTVWMGKIRRLGSVKSVFIRG